METLELKLAVMYNEKTDRSLMITVTSVLVFELLF